MTDYYDPSKEAFWANIRASAALTEGQPKYTQAGLVLSENFEGGREHFCDVIADPKTTQTERLKAMADLIALPAHPANRAEVWKPYPEFPQYEASSKGRIKSVKTGIVLKPRMDRDYPRVQLAVRTAGNEKRRVWRFVHCMVCTAFHGKRPTPAHEAAHRNGYRPDCREANLYWGTRKDQTDDKRKHGTLAKSVPPRGNASRCAGEILKLLDAGFSRTRIGELLGCHRSTVTKVADRTLRAGATP